MGLNLRQGYGFILYRFIFDTTIQAYFSHKCGGLFLTYCLGVRSISYLDMGLFLRHSSEILTILGKDSQSSLTPCSCGVGCEYPSTEFSMSLA